MFIESCHDDLSKGEHRMLEIPDVPVVAEEASLDAPLEHALVGGLVPGPWRLFGCT